MLLLIFICQDAATGKVAGLQQQQQQWQNLPMSSGFPVGHSKMAAESASWEDLAAAVKGTGKSVMCIVTAVLTLF